MGLFPTDANDGDEVTNTNGTVFKYNAAEDRWYIIGKFTISNIPYDAGTWDDNQDGATKDAIRDKIESMGGETNTGSNQGTDGIGVYDTKVDVDLQFRHIAPASSKITITLNGKDIDVDIAEAQLSLANLGTRDHASLSDAPTSAHHVKTIASELNHNDLANINAGDDYEHLTLTEKNSIGDAYFLETKELDMTGIADTKILKYNGTKWVITDDETGGAGGDTDAIHDNVADEITAIILKAIPVSADEIILEDSEASYVKKSATIGSIVPDRAFYGENLTERSTSSQSYAKLKEMEAMVDSKHMLVSWEHKRGSGVYGVYTACYLNGNLLGGAVRNLTTTWTLAFYEYTGEIVDGDLLQIYGYNQGSSNFCHVRNFLIRAWKPNLSY